MKKLYSFSTLLVVLVLFTGCSKDFLKPYDDRIVGVWQLDDVDRIGWGSTNLNFTGGRFTFYGSGQVEYEDGNGGFYEGRWDIRTHTYSDSYTDENGNMVTNNNTMRSLQINVTDFVTHDVRSEYFDDMTFTGTNKFNAYLYDGPRTYVFKFRR